MKSFIIHLPKIHDSLKTALNLKAQLDRFNMPVELFEGTYGNDAVEIFQIENRIYDKAGFPSLDEAEKYEHKSSYPGVKGCFYSHYRLWQKCIELNESIIVWEDDVILKRPFTPVEWDDVLILALGFKDMANTYFHLLETDQPPMPLLYNEYHVPGTPGYAITVSGAKKLVERYKNSYLPSDIAMNKKVIDIKIHSQIMGKAIIDEKISLVRNLKFWSRFGNEKNFNNR
jgi:GR25 family glycosyltransferase involved in LPS biosynthesis